MRNTIAWMFSLIAKRTPTEVSPRMMILSVVVSLLRVFMSLPKVTCLIRRRWISSADLDGVYEPYIHANLYLTNP